MKKTRIVCLATVLAAAWLVWWPSAAHGSVLLGSYEFWTNGGGSPEPDPRVELVLQLPTTFPSSDYFGLGADAGIFWEDGDQGAVDFTSSNEPAFDEFALYATDGVSDLFMLWTLFPTGGGKGNLGAEENLFGGSSDLDGYELDIVRLVVDEVQIVAWNPDPGNDPALAGYKFSVRGSFEFYGAAVPEPASLCLFGIVGIFTSKSTRFCRTALNEGNR